MWVKRLRCTWRAKQLRSVHGPSSIDEDLARPIKDLELTPLVSRELDMRLPNRILHTACLLGFKKETPHYAGSGFVVAVPGAHGNSHLYLVTAKHLAERMECHPGLAPRFETNG